MCLPSDPRYAGDITGLFCGAGSGDYLTTCRLHSAGQGPSATTGLITSKARSRTLVLPRRSRGLVVAYRSALSRGGCAHDPRHPEAAAAVPHARTDRDGIPPNSSHAPATLPRHGALSEGGGSMSALHDRKAVLEHDSATDAVPEETEEDVAFLPVRPPASPNTEPGPVLGPLLALSGAKQDWRARLP